MIRTHLKKISRGRLFIALLLPLLAIAGNYTVKKWDTIWDLSGTYLGDPYLWEKIWAVNSHINDPHWIYPGDVLNIPGAGSNSESSTADTESDLNSGESSANINTTDLKYTVPSLSSGFDSNSSGQVISSDSYKSGGVNFNSKAYTEALFRQISFLWEKANGTGLITPGDAYIYEKKEIGTFREYVDIRCVIESGSNYSVGDTVEIIHPIKTQKLKGRITTLVKKVALATVREIYRDASGQSMMKIRIYKLWDSVVNNDRVVKAEAVPSMMVESVTEPDRKLQGKLLINAEKGAVSYVFKPFILDIGKSEGVQRGDIFLIYKNEGTEIQKEPSAMGFIIYTTDLSSTLMITAMKNIVNEGDQVSLFKRVTLK